MIEIAIKVSDECQSLKVKHILYDVELLLSKEDKTLKHLVEKAVADFKGDAQDVSVTIRMGW